MWKIENLSNYVVKKAFLKKSVKFNVSIGNAYL